MNRLYEHFSIASRFLTYSSHLFQKCIKFKFWVRRESQIHKSKITISEIRSHNNCEGKETLYI